MIMPMASSGETDVDGLEAVLGHNIRARRTAAGFTQVGLSERANVSLGALRHLESGAGANTTTLVKVLRALDATGWLDALAPPPPRFSPLAELAAQERTPGRSPKGPQRVRRRHQTRTP